MFVALWEYEVKPGCEKRFEEVYGPEGEWVGLFRSDTHYHQTLLLRDALRGGAYLTLDFWESREAYENFLSERRAEYEAIDKASAGLTTSERKIGWFEMGGGSSQ
jgi:heme-degrading monooxygenase HmoA